MRKVSTLVTITFLAGAVWISPVNSGTAPPTPVGSGEISIVESNKFKGEIKTVREVAANVPGATPDAPVIGIRFVDDLKAPGLERNGLILIDSGLINPDKIIIHELAHAVTPGHGHDEVWCEVFFKSSAQFIPDQYESITKHTIAWHPESCSALVTSD